MHASINCNSWVPQVGGKDASCHKPPSTWLSAQGHPSELCSPLPHLEAPFPTSGWPTPDFRSVPPSKSSPFPASSHTSCLVIKKKIHHPRESTCLRSPPTPRRLQEPLSWSLASYLCHLQSVLSTAPQSVIWRVNQVRPSHSAAHDPTKTPSSLSTLL